MAEIGAKFMFSNAVVDPDDMTITEYVDDSVQTVDINEILKGISGAKIEHLLIEAVYKTCLDGGVA